MISTKNLNYIGNFKSFGKSIGICFQLIDDYLDYTGETKIMGKSVGDDFFNSKLTYPIILTLKKGDKVDTDKIKKLFLKSNKSQNDLSTLLEILDRYDALENTKKEAIKWSKQARKSLQKIPQSSIKNLLEEISNYIISRTS